MINFCLYLCLYVLHIRMSIIKGKFYIELVIQHTQTKFTEKKNIPKRSRHYHNKQAKICK